VGKIRRPQLGIIGRPLTVAAGIGTVGAEKSLHVAPSAGLGEVEHDTLDRIEGRRAVAPQIRPMRLAVARLEHRHRRLVGVQHRSAEQCGLQRVDQRLQLDAAGAHPLRQRGARQAHPRPLEDRLLPVQRQMVGIFGHQHLGQQPGGGQPLGASQGSCRLSHAAFC
jgi:hypothetical protein